MFNFLFGPIEFLVTQNLYLYNEKSKMTREKAIEIIRKSDVFYHAQAENFDPNIDIRYKYSCKWTKVEEKPSCVMIEKGKQYKYRFKSKNGMEYTLYDELIGIDD